MTPEMIEAAAIAMCRDIAGIPWGDAHDVVRGYLRRLATAALTAAEAAAWQPIETAPKGTDDDVAIVDLYRPGVSEWLQVTPGRYDDNRHAKNPVPYWRSQNRLMGVIWDLRNPPTHWRLRPAPPSAKP